jgi:hypothetical protein
MVKLDARTHVAVPGLAGRRAWCGAGRITVPIEGRFDPTDRLACADCAERLNALDAAVAEDEVG